MSGPRAALAAIAALMAGTVALVAVPPEASAERKVALIRLDSLGMDAERVRRLESLFRIEIERVAGKMPSPRAVQRVLRQPKHRGCGGESKCLISIGKALAVDVVVSGSVAALGDAYVVNIKAVAVSSGDVLSRVESEPLRGNPAELIENVRLAAYRLLAPDQLLGEVSVLADIDGAEILIDDKVVGKTPLSRPISGIAVGKHRLEVRGDGYKGFTQEIVVRFKKNTQVVVSLTGAAPIATPAVVVVKKKKPFYKRGWFWAVVGVSSAALVTGIVIGTNLGGAEVVSCPGSPGC